MRDICGKVQSGEPAVKKYQMFLENKKPGRAEQDVIMIETYENMDIHEKHLKMEGFQNLAKSLKEEDLLLGELQIKYITPVGGFEARL